MLIQIFFYVFMLFAVAALAVDLGLARLTQTQLQNAADTAALEALRQGRTEAVALAGQALQDGSKAGVDSIVTFTDSGVGALGASAKYDADDPGVFVPLEPNLANAKEGDMVSGCYTGDPNHAEQADYTRADFDGGCLTQRSALVRIRRTNNSLGLDQQAGVSSNRAPIPLLFGRGTTNLSQRTNGIPVRATAIADARPALRVGAPVAGLLPGVTSFALASDFWDSTAEPSNRVCMLATNALDPGILSSGVFPNAGHYVQPAQVVGVPVVPVSTGSLPVPGTEAYVPIMKTTGEVVGFGSVRLESPSCPGGQFDLVRESSRIATANATAVLTSPPPGLAAFLAANPAPAGALLVPVLVR